MTSSTICVNHKLKVLECHIGQAEKIKVVRLFLQQNSLEEARLKLNETEEVLTQMLYLKMNTQTKILI